MRVLALEPFYGGSHRLFLDQWSSRSSHEFDIVGLSARKWKWRMRQSAIQMAAEIDRRLGAGERWDLLFASDMLNLAELKGLSKPALSALPSVLYFHENQITYPVRQESERDYHFGLTNFVSALAASQLWFNSEFHLCSFFEALPTFLRKMPDHRPLDRIASLRERSSVQWPGVEDPRSVITGERSAVDGPLHVLWVARWEHDKDPSTFFKALYRLAERGTPFRLSVLGESYGEVPEVFGEARERLTDHIDVWGFQSARRDYLEQLMRADVVVSTAQHEFFGIAVLEAILAGVRPLLPDRLSYPELLAAGGEDGGAFLYAGGAGELMQRLRQLAELKEQGRLHARRAQRAAERFVWSRRAVELDQALAGLVADFKRPASTSASDCGRGGA